MYRTTIIIVIALVALGGMAVGQPACNADPSQNICMLSAWSSWSPCEPACTNIYDEERSQSRIRTVLCPTNAVCPNDGQGLFQTQDCPYLDCTPEQLRCQGSCVGCQVVQGYTRTTENWCRCCSNQDTAGQYYLANPCSAATVGDNGGCLAAFKNTSYDFPGCLRDGFCRPRGDGTLICQEYGYCSGIASPVPAPTTSSVFVTTAGTVATTVGTVGTTASGPVSTFAGITIPTTMDPTRDFCLNYLAGNVNGTMILNSPNVVAPQAVVVSAASSASSSGSTSNGTSGWMIVAGVFISLFLVVSGVLAGVAIKRTLHNSGPEGIHMGNLRARTSGQ